MALLTLPPYIDVLPEKIIVNQGSIRAVPNTKQQLVRYPLMFAYRKTSGADKRIRILSRMLDIMGDPTYRLLYATGPKKKTEMVAGSTITVRNGFNRAESIARYWDANMHSFVEGGSYSSDQHHITLLTVDEHKALLASRILEDWTTPVESLIY
jgi:hypothetical protein